MPRPTAQSSMHWKRSTKQLAEKMFRRLAQPKPPFLDQMKQLLHAVKNSIGLATLFDRYEDG